MMNRLLGGFLLSAISLLGGSVAANATTVRIGDNINSPQSITIQRTVEGVTNPVSNTFTYLVEPDENNPAPTSGYFNTVSLVFNGEVPDANNKVTQTAQLDMSNVAFSQVGDYRFKIKEDISSNSIVFPLDSVHEYYVCVSVRNEVSYNRPTGNLIATLAMQVEDAATGEKTDATFNAKASFTYIQISKEVTGNAARTDEYFRFRIRMDHAPAGERYVISGQDTVVEYNGESINTQNEFIVGEENIIYLKHGQTAYIGISGDLYQIRHGTDYSFSEDVPDGYAVTLNDRNGVSSGTGVVASFVDDGVLPMNNKVRFVNHKESAVLTGVSTAVVPISILAVIGVGSFVIARKLRKSE